MKHIAFAILVGLFLCCITVPAFAQTEQVGDTGAAIVDSTEPEATVESALVYTMVIDGGIGAVTDDRIVEAIEIAEDNDAELLVILLDTPGGFTRPTWSICKHILNSDVPVCMYIAPPGARAGSAGVYMTYASHIAAMAPSTNIGAAHPVTGGGEAPDSIMNEKITNDAVAQVKAAAEKHGRNAEWAEKSVRESASITAQEALEMNVVDIVADDLDDLLAQIDGREVELPWGTRKMSLENVTTEELEISFVHRFLGIITSPDIVFILFSIGSLGIVLELYNPGAILPGVVGAISLILAFYASQTLPINYAGVALIFLAVIMWIAEVKIISHGLLTIGGIISFFLGGLMLIDTVDPELKVSLSLLISVAVIVGLIVSLVLVLVIKTARSRPTTGMQGMIGKKAEVRKVGMVYVDGALWKAECDVPLEIGDRVDVLEVVGLMLKVRKIES